MPLNVALGKQWVGVGGSVFLGWENSELHALLWLPEFLTKTEFRLPVE